MAMVREQDVFFALGPALDFGLTLNARRGRLRRHGARRRSSACAVFVVCMLPQLLAYHALNGHPSPVALVSRKMTGRAARARGAVSPEHGFFFWTPLAVWPSPGSWRWRRAGWPTALTRAASESALP